MLMRRIQSVRDRMFAYMVRNRLISARSCGFRSLRELTLQECCGSLGSRLIEHERPRIVACPLPANIPRREDLSRQCGRYERSFFDVPELQLQARYSTRLENCRILRHRNEWGDDFYVLVTEDDQQIPYSGTGFQPGHRELLRRDVVTRRLSEATWIITHSTRNHYMWLYNHLTRLMLAEDLSLQQSVLFPEKSLLSTVKLETLNRMGYDSPQFIQPDDQVIAVDRLNLMEVDCFDPWALERLRKRLGGPPQAAPTRRIYISRQKCHYRKLSNESELLPWLTAHGFETVFLEDLSLGQQIATMQSAKVVLGVHGAGFANLLFCQPGTTVIEIQDPEDPNPHFYALAALLGLKYNLLVGDVDIKAEPHFRDLKIGWENIDRVLSTAAADDGSSIP